MSMGTAAVGRVAARVLAAVVALGGVMVLPAAPAFAAGPELTVTKAGPGTALAGSPIDYTLTVVNPDQSGAVPEYNVAFRDELPVGVTYVAGSTAPASLGEPRVVVDTVDGHQTLIWENVTDLPVGSDQGLSFSALPDDAMYPVGATVTNLASVHGQSDPRLLPRFDLNGDLVPGSASESGTSPAEITTITALTIAKAEASPERELVRGVHTHPTRYTLTVRNSGRGATSGVTVVDYLPAELELLGCGDVDNSAAVEYPGAPGLDAAPDVTTDCLTPVRVETVLDPVGKPAGVYTRVEWAVGPMASGQVQRIVYSAGIPQRENTLSFPGGAPTPTSLGQTANLDNNTGPSTREQTAESSVRNVAEVSGTYGGAVAPGTSPAVSDTDSLTVMVEDVSMQKSVSPSGFTGGGIATYTLRIALSEYVDATNIVVRDHLPDGLCPLDDTTNHTPGAPAECAPAAGFAPTGASLADVVANPDGSFDLTFTPVSGVRDDVLTITYQARMRETYGSSGRPTVSGDGFVNTAALTGTTTPAPGVASPDAGPVEVTDDSAASLTTDTPTLDKRIQPDATPMACSSSPGDYVEPADQPGGDFSFAEGSRVCFLVRVDFPGANSTRNPTLTDFLPAYASYEAGSAVLSPGSQPAALASTDPLVWEIGTTQGSARFVPRGSFFEVRFSALVNDPAAGPAVDITDNLAKLRWRNTGEQSQGLRDQVGFEIEPAPPATILKGAVRATAPGTPLPEGATVVADEVLRYTVTVGNGGSAANDNDTPIYGPDVWDVLPVGVTCADISTISSSGVCTDPGAVGHPTFAGNGTRSAIRWNLPDTVVIAPGSTLALTYELRVPSAASVTTTYTNTASVASYASATNLPTLATHFPASNVDTTVPADEIDAPAATDSFTVVTPNAGVTKSNVTSITEAGNGLNQAVVGELVTYTVTARVPAHTSVYDAVLTDPLPTGLTFVSASAQLSTDNGATYAPLPPGFTVSATTGTVTFPAMYTNSSGDDDLVRVLITARVANIASNTHNAVRTNTASLATRTAPGGTALPVRTATSQVTVVNPAPGLTKTEDDPDNLVSAGQVLTYTLTASNTAGRPPAHDAFVVDCVPGVLSVTGLVAGSPTQGSATYAASTGSDGCAVGTTRIVWNLGDVAPGTSPTLRYTARVSDTAGGLAPITNTATRTSSTLDDNKTTVTDPDNPVERVFSGTATTTVTVRGAAIAKTVDQPTRAVGERATFSVTTTVPADVNFFDAAVTDVMPAGLDQSTLTTQSVTCARADSSPCPVDGTALAPAGATTIGWALGDLTSDPQVRTIQVVYSAVVADVSANVAGRALTNSAQVRWNSVDGTMPPTAGGTWQRSSAPTTATVVVTEPSLSVDKSVSDPAPEPGQVFDYTVAVTNATGVNVSGAFQITLVDTVPVGVVVAGGSISDGGVLSGATADGGGTITWTLAGPLAPGATRTLGYQAALASPTLVDPLTNTADITRYTSVATGGRTYDGPSDTATVTAALPHVSIAKSVVGGPVAYVGEPKAWRLEITSDGDARAFGVDAEDVLPPSWTYDAGSAQVSVNGAAPTQEEPTTTTSGVVQTLTWTDLADLPVGQTLVITFTATPQPDALTDPGAGNDVDHVNTASTTAEDADGNRGPAGGGSYAGPPDTAVAHLDSADVTVTKTHAQAPVAGESFSWSIQVANAGPDTAVGPFPVTDTLPTGVTGPVAAGPGWTCSVSADQVTCVRSDPADTLASGASFPPITVTVSIPADTPDGTALTNTASVTSRTHDPDLTNNTDDDSATVDTVADLAVDKSLVGTLVAGEDATYTLDVTNLGPSVSQGEIVVTDVLPAGSTFGSANGAGWDCSESGSEVTCTRTGTVDLGPLPQITITVGIPSDQVADVVNSAHVDGPLDDNPDNDDDQVTTTPSTSADLSLEKESPDDFVAGATGSYRFTVTNNGPSDARAPVTLTDTLPSMLTYVDAASVDGTWSCGSVGQAVTCTLTGDLAAGASAVVEIDVDIDPDHTGAVLNSAEVTSGTPDPNPGDNTDDDDTGVDTRADLSVQKSHTGPVVAGGQVTYDLTVRNNGPSRSPATVTVTDTLPAGMSYAGSSGDPWSCTAAAQLVTCELSGSVAAGTEAPPLAVTADVAPDAGPATLVNTAQVTGPLTDPVPGNNSDDDPTDVVDEAELTLVKSVTGANPVVAGGTVEFDLVVHNDGPSDADAVSVTDTLPPGLTLVSATGAGWTCDSGAPFQCTRDVVAAGSDAPVITVVARVGSGTPDGSSLTNTATAATSTPGDDPADNTDDAVVDVVASADLVATKSHPTGEVVAGTATAFRIEVRNDGASDAVGPIVVTDTLPSAMSYLSAAGGWTCTAAGDEVTCTLPGPLVAGASAPDLLLTVQVAAEVNPSTLTNTATVGSGTTDPDPGNNTDDEEVTVTEQADLSIVKTHTGDGIVGAQVSFELAVANAGPSEADQVTVTDTLPSGLELVSASGPGWTCQTTGNQLSCLLDTSLAPAATAPVITVVATVTPAAYPGVVNTAHVGSTAFDPTPENNSSDDPVTVPALVDLEVVKSHEGTAKVGQTLTFALAVTNQGPTPDPGPITLSDQLPDGLGFVSAQGDGWTCEESDGLLTCLHPDPLGVEESTAVELVVEVAPGAVPGVVNVATVSSDSADTDETNNVDEDAVDVVPLVVLGLEKTAVSVSADRVVFDLTVTNEGPNDTVAPVVLTDALPAGLRFVSAAGDGWRCGHAGGTLTCTYEDVLEAGESATVRLVTEATSSGGQQVTNVAEVSGGGADDVVSDDAVVTVPAGPDGSELPDTGGPSRWWLLAGLLGTLAGVALLAGSRGRLRSSQ